MMKKVNCKHFNDYGYCKEYGRKFLGFLWLVRIRCVEYDGFAKCEKAVRYTKPPPTPPPTPTPLPFEIKGNGVVSVKVEDIFNNPSCMEQIRACKDIKVEKKSD